MRKRLDIPRTEEGLQSVLAGLADARKRRDRMSEAEALLDLALLVKWVRSDNKQTPFERSHTLALQALEIFRELNDSEGQIGALLSALRFEPPGRAAEMHDEADKLAKHLGDPLWNALILASRGRRMALEDPDKAKEINLQALRLFTELGDSKAMAHCHFSLMICPGSLSEHRDHALEAARLFREAGDLRGACRVLTLALLHTKNSEDLAAMEPAIWQGIEDARACGHSASEADCYAYLGRIAKNKGDGGLAKEYVARAKRLRSKG